MSCKWDIAWVGLCGAPEVERGLCAKHAGQKCTSCGGHATHECDHTGQFVCGASLCDNCKGTGGDSTQGLGWGFMGHVHKPKTSSVGKEPKP